MYGCFYDNNANNEDYSLLCPYVYFYRVEDTPMFSEGDSEALTLKMASEDVGVRKVYEMYKSHYSKCYYDPYSGMRLSSGESLFGHVIRHAQRPEVTSFIFDWDRTLQQYECMTTRSFNSWALDYGAVSDSEKKEFAKSLAIFHAGGKDRFDQLRNMFGHLNANNKAVSVLTGNPAILTEGRSVYLAIINEWGIRPYVLAYAPNKYEFMWSNNYFQTSLGPVLSF